MVMAPEIAANIEAVRQRMQAAARRAGRRVDEITLVAVTKTHPVATVIAAYQAGLRHFGENRAQEYVDKAAGLSAWLENNPAHEAASWHFIGHVQSRQVGLILAGRPKLIHSVDSLKLAERLHRLAGREGYPPVEILLQCNVSGEETKSGFALDCWADSKEQFTEFLGEVQQIAALDQVVIRGLMSMAPFSDDPETARPTFRSLAALRAKLQADMGHLDWGHLSMGMTDDFEVAIEEGSTLVRVGRAIFGERS
jgi:pyridoxal phosphate enzyme (YggS family)